MRLEILSAVSQITSASAVETLMRTKLRRFNYIGSITNGEVPRDPTAQRPVKKQPRI